MRTFLFLWSLALFCVFKVSFAESTLAELQGDVSGASTPINPAVKSIVNWQADIDLEVVCVLTEKPDSTGNSLPERRLTFYKKDKDRMQKLFEFETVDYPISVYPLTGGGGRLFTTWTGGSAYHFYVFAFVDGKIKQVLESGSKQPTEFLLDKNGNEIILVTQTTRVEDKKTKESIEIPYNTQIFKWNGSKYTLIKTVPWQARLQYVQKYLLK